MSKLVKVYNKGIKPVVFKRDLTGVDAIHPGKFMTFEAEKAAGIIKDHKDACSEEDFKKHQEEVKKAAAEAKKKAEAEAKKKAKESESGGSE